MKNVESLHAAALVIAGLLFTSGPVLAAASDTAGGDSGGSEAKSAASDTAGADASNTPAPDTHKKRKHHAGHKKMPAGGAEGSTGAAPSETPSSGGSD
ncbi:MAG TPA: hypothetical protein VMR29_00770 [Candidatus Binatia bacterium]|nr:hypothetical protein [Candidatus Binatia bacterium]